MTHQGFTTLAEAEQYAASKGVKLAAADRENIRKSQQAELNRLKGIHTTERTSGVRRLVEEFNRLYPRFLEFLIGVGDILMTFTQTVMVSLGVPLVLVLLLFVEQQRVVHGIMLFEADPVLAAFASWALVILNLVLEFMIHYIEHQAQYTVAASSRFSLRVWLQNARYFLGIDPNWQSRPVSPAQWYKSILRLVTFTILALALTGSMQGVIAGAEGSWYVGITSIVTESSLLLLMTWIGGLLFAAVAVLGAQSMSRAVAVRTVEVVTRMNGRLNTANDEYGAALDAVGAQYVLAKVAASQARQHERDAAEVASATIPFSMNGTKSH